MLDQEQPALKRAVGGKLVNGMITWGFCWFWRHNEVLQQLEGLVGEEGPTGSKMIKKQNNLLQFQVDTPTYNYKGDGVAQW